MKNYLIIILNLCIAIVTFFIMCSFFKPANGKSGWQRVLGLFKYFTIQSNVFSAIVSVITLFYMFTGRQIPEWLMVLRFVATVTVTLTCLTVMLYLGRLYGYKSQLSEENIHLHLMGPLMAFVSTCFLEKGMKLSLGQMLLGMIPTMLYGILYIYEAAVKKNWSDFYGFVKADMIKSSIIMMILTALICILTGLVYNL